MIKLKTTKTKKKTLGELVNQKTKEIEKEKRKAKAEFVEKIKNEIIPRAGDVVTGKVIEIGKNIIYIDLGPLGIGVIRGKELWETMDAYTDLKVGDEVKVTILELENREGNIELTFKKLSKEQAWKELIEKKNKGETFSVKIQNANKGGLLTTIAGISAFMPVSQLTPEHYPRVEGGDQDKILSKLQKFIGKKMTVKVLAVNPKEDKLILSEKMAALDQQKKRLNLLRVGDIVEGTVSGVVDFGAFVKFPSPRKKDEIFEGLVHISELSWKRVSDPENIVKVGDKVKAEIIGIDETKITLSIKKLQKDPWQTAIKKYKVGQIVEGKIIKIEPFGAFVQLDKDIHGLAHISELSNEKIKHPEEALRVGEKKKFKILSIEPEEHRLGLSLKITEKRKTKENKAEVKDKIKSKK